MKVPLEIARCPVCEEQVELEYEDKFILYCSVEPSISSHEWIQWAKTHFYKDGERIAFQKEWQNKICRVERWLQHLVLGRLMETLTDDE